MSFIRGHEKMEGLEFNCYFAWEIGHATMYVGIGGDSHITFNIKAPGTDWELHVRFTPDQLFFYRKNVYIDSFRISRGDYDTIDSFLFTLKQKMEIVVEKMDKI